MPAQDSETPCSTPLAPKVRRGRPPKPRVPRHGRALIEWASTWDPATKSRFFEALGVSRAQGENVLDGRRGVDPDWLRTLRAPVSPGFPAPCPAAVPTSALVAATLGRGLEELRQLRGVRTPERLHVACAGLDHLAVLGQLRDEALAQLEDRLAVVIDRGLDLGTAVVTAKCWRHCIREHEFPIGFDRTYAFEDVRDDSRLGFLSVGLRRGWRVQRRRVKLTVTGQGCARGVLVPLVRELLGDAVEPESISVDVDVAVDIAVEPGALMPIHVGDSECGPRRVRSFWGQNMWDGILGAGLELGSRSSRTSLSFYDKRAQVRAAREPGARHHLTWLAAHYSLPHPVPSDLVRAELRVRDIRGAAGVPDVVTELARRFGIVDLRRVPIVDGMDELIVVKAREWGVARAIPTPARQRAELRDARKAGVAYLPDRGLAAGVQRSLLEAGRSDVEARRHASAINDRAFELLTEGAARTPLDFAKEVGIAIRAAWPLVEAALQGESPTA